MPLVEAHQLRKHYREGGRIVPVLGGIDLAVERGELVALEGPSGSGKTTLLFILGCLLTQDSGRVVIDGLEIDPGDRGALPEVRRRYIGLVFQHFHLFAALTAVENVEYALRLKGIRGRSARAESARLIDTVGLTRRARALPADLSGGEKQRVAIARALAGSTPLVLADEPTSSLDSAIGREILDVLREVVDREGRTVLIVTHDPRARQVADRVVQIRDGRLIAGEG